MPELSDREILLQTEKGDVNAFAILVERYKDKAFSLAMSILGTHNIAEEAVQDAFVRAYKGIKGFKAESTFSTWFYRIVYNVCITKSRDKKKRLDRFQEQDEDFDFTGNASLPSDQMESEEFQSIVHNEIHTLPDHYKILLTMFFVQEMSYNEIVEVTSLPLGTVKTRLHRARTILRKNVLKHYDTLISSDRLK